MWKVSGRQTTDAKWCQKLTLPLARCAYRNTRNREDTYINQRLSGLMLCQTNQKQELSMAAMFVNGSARNEQSLYKTFHRYYLPSFRSFGQAVLEKNFRNQPIRNRNIIWQPRLLTDRNEMSCLYRGPSIDAPCQVSVHLGKWFQRRWFFLKK
jgi:hypothetical protein